MKRLLKPLNIINKNDEAVVGVVVAVLLVGLMLAIVAILQTVFVPSWMEQLEAGHMDEVADQFALLKFAIDTQSATEKNIPITTSMTLGNKELPFLSSSRSFGSLRIVSEECCINFTNATDTLSFSPGIIKYSSSNAYFLDQSYIYEAGAVISSQAEGSVMFIIPSFLVDYDKVLDEVNISFTLADIKGVGGKKSVTGYGTYPIQTNFSKTNLTNVTDLDHIKITTNYPNAWHLFINSTLIKKDLVYGTGNDFWITSTDDVVTINFNTSPGHPKVDIYVEVVDIIAQIAPGWIE